MATRTTAAIWATRAMAGFQIAVGLYQAIDPVEGAAGFLGVTTFDHSTASPLMRAVAGRNLASGVVMAVLTLTGQTRSAGTMMLCGLITQLCDILACARIDGNWRGHAFLAPFTAALGWWVMTSNDLE